MLAEVLILVEIFVPSNVSKPQQEKGDKQSTSSIKTRIKLIQY